MQDVESSTERLVEIINRKLAQDRVLGNNAVIVNVDTDGRLVSYFANRPNGRMSRRYRRLVRQAKSELRAMEATAGGRARLAGARLADSRLVIIIVNWNTRDLVLDCLRSVCDDLDNTELKGEVWVVDNASEDGSADAIRESFPQVHLLESDENLGFAGGNNLALREIGFPDGDDLPEYVLLLNPDTVVRPGALDTLVKGMVSTGAGLAGARLVYGDESFQHSAFAFPGLAQLIIDLFPVPGRLHEGRLNGRYSHSLYEGGQPFEVDHPLGATFLLRREVIQQTGLFDESFHLYCEEIDWAMRIKSAGWRVVCIPEAEVVHYEGQSTGQVRPRSIINLWTARLKLYRKHYNPIKRIVAIWIVRAGMNHLIKSTARDSSRSEADSRELVNAYHQVIKLSRTL